MNIKYNISVITTNPKDSYSGGRYHALMLAEALAENNHNVHYVANCLPIFWKDLKAFSSHSKIKPIIGAHDTIFRKVPKNLDFVFIVPGTNDYSFYENAIAMAFSRKARVILVNFESGNWFNEFSIERRDLSNWKGWKQVAAAAHVILSSSSEGSKYARDFYKDIPRYCTFDTCYPSINTVAADSVQNIDRQNRIILLSRFSGDTHKGGNLISSIVGDYMSGYILTVLVGTGAIPIKILEDLEKVCEHHDVTLDLRYRISDKEKFELYKSSKVLLFPSYFEGYGYPPIEARYCGCSVIAFDLPVLRETCGNDITLVEHGNVYAFKSAIRNFLSEDTEVSRYKLDETAPLSQMAIRLESILSKTIKTDIDYNFYLSKYDYPYLSSAGVLNSLVNNINKVIAKVVRFARRKLKSTNGVITYYPRFRTNQDLTNHFYRATWYFPKSSGVVENVNMYISDSSVQLETPPKHMHDCSIKKDHININRSKFNYLSDLFFADVVMIWDSKSKYKKIFWLLEMLGVVVVNVDTNDVDGKEYGDYPGVIWRYLLSNNERKNIIDSSHKKLLDIFIEDKIKVKASVVFGTGPSISMAKSFCYDDCFSIVCNSIVQDHELMEHISPRIITAGDAVSHFGVSQYAAKFREDLILALKKYPNLYYFGTATFGYALSIHYPEVAHKMIFIEQKTVGPNYNLIQDYSAPMLDSTMNIHMLPLAATMNNDVYILGCDGKSKVKSNEDFWAHAPGCQYHHLVDTGHLCHPTFDQHRKVSTYQSHLESVRMTLDGGEKIGKRYASLKESNIPAFHVRELTTDWYADNGFEDVVKVTSIADIRGDIEYLLKCEESLKGLESIIGVSQVNINNNHLVIKGWCLASKFNTDLYISFDQGQNQKQQMDFIYRRIARPDVAQKYPEYKQDKAGFFYTKELNKESISKSELIFRLIIKDGNKILQTKNFKETIG